MQMIQSMMHGLLPREKQRKFCLQQAVSRDIQGTPLKKVDRMWLWTSGIDTYELVDCDKYSYEKKRNKG